MTTHRFAPRSGEDIVNLVRTQRLAWVVSANDGDFQATLLPLLPILGPSGGLEGLAGHFARSNDHIEKLRAQSRALVLFLGPNGYISPSWIHDKTWGPTWNYAAVQFVVDIEFIDDPAYTDEHLSELVTTMEAGRPEAWNIGLMGPRYATLARHVTGFRARIVETRARFKLGQDERDAVLGDITVALNREGQHDLLQWMKEFNPQRPA
ncbi:transcriptional regulator [Povalibacter uvarum]|uniref:Transcriptional regulator n=1 Tax=Povalibacter uvarum TaxID=732238 RepID=A0A841HS27_9GAMM|nr:FMN-binding negative transcriptional regulator [Povalibacter uvarum]MBB6095454.1 transcriptional regulator [Povalibacter uvarum]